MQSHRRSSRLLALILAATLVLGTLIGAVALVAAPAQADSSPAASATPSPSAETASERPTSADGARPLVLLGTTGLTWEDLDPTMTPTLWATAQEGAIGSLVVRNQRTTTCPAEGWLAVSSGSRSVDLPAAERLTDMSGQRCRPLVEAAATTEGGAPVPGWADFATAASDSAYAARIGLLGDEIAADGLTAAAVGPGAAIALATSGGVVAGQAAARPDVPAELTPLVAALVATNDVVVVDLGNVQDWVAPRLADGSVDETVEAPDPESYRTAQVLAVEARAAAALTGAEEGARTRAESVPAGGLEGEPLVVVASLADSGRSPALQVLAVAEGERSGTLTTTSTRQRGYVLSTDLLPWFLDTLGLTTTTASGASLVGAAPSVAPGRRPPTPGTGGSPRSRTTTPMPRRSVRSSRRSTSSWSSRTSCSTRWWRSGSPARRRRRSAPSWVVGCTSTAGTSRSASSGPGCYGR
ncbi:hypothetical protein [Salana multivorans]